LERSGTVQIMTSITLVKILGFKFKSGTYKKMKVPQKLEKIATKPPTLRSLQSLKETFSALMRRMASAIIG
jgi:hypothetical protein